MSFNPYNRNAYILNNGVPVEVFLRDPQSNLRARNRRDYDVQYGKWNNPIVHDPRIIGRSAKINQETDDDNIVVGPRPTKRPRISDLDRAIQMFNEGAQRPEYQQYSQAFLQRIEDSAQRLSQLTAKEARKLRADMETYAKLLRFPNAASYFTARRLIFDAPDEVSAPVMALLQNEMAPEIYEWAILQEQTYNDNIGIQVNSILPYAKGFYPTLERLEEPNLGFATEEEFDSYKTEQLNQYDTLSGLLEGYMELPDETPDQTIFDAFVERKITNSTLDFDVEQRNLFAAVSRFPASAAQLQTLQYAVPGQAGPAREEVTPEVFVELMTLRESGTEEPLKGYTLVKGLGDEVKTYAENIYKFYEQVIDKQDQIGVVGTDLSGKLRAPGAPAIQKRLFAPVLLNELNEAEEKWYKEPEKRIVDRANELVPGSNYKTLQDVLKSVDAFERFRDSKPAEEREFGGGYAVWAREWASIRKAVQMYGDGTAQKGVLEDGRDTVAYTKEVLEKASQGLADIGRAFSEERSGGGGKRRTRK